MFYIYNIGTTNNRKGASGYNNMHDGDDNRAPLKYATHDAKLGDKEAESSELNIKRTVLVTGGLQWLQLKPLLKIHIVCC